ncbi:MAG: SirA family protein [Rhodospirillaceae bacterium]|jgi:tRNA 2-thiouridine synthesizing protein A|nr:SirA family protein [Rhodospirillaceae bacterium]|tara:strand:- start:1642 stop:1866 length:225 start_codon:yes stop_codon:yes gene_type:complete
MATSLLDVKGLNCPSPIIQMKKAMNSLNSGDTLEVLSTDSMSVKDFNTFCRATGNVLLESGEDDGVYRFLIQKA